MKDVLFINACARKESRTLILAREALARLTEKGDCTIEEINVHALGLKSLDGESAAKRDMLISRGITDDPLTCHAARLAKADEIVIAAPYWDLSFPSALRVYLEYVSAVGLTFAYDDKGAPYGMCRATRLIYITTAGGDTSGYDLGFGYVTALFRKFLGSPRLAIVGIKAEGLDIVGADVPDILARAKREIAEKIRPHS